MSATQVQKLNALLTRVQQRRQEPRLVSVGVTAPSANTNLAAPALGLAKPELAALSIEEAIAPASPSSLPPAAPSSIPPPAAPSSIPPPAQRKPSSSTVPPSENAPHALGRARTEVLPAAEPPPTAGVRVAASAALPFDSAVKVTSSPRIEAAKSFGDLLELSLALRPKTG
ncbi:MAG: hypothetical protein ABW352_21625 [Polyangiales bacterium]